MKELPNRQVKGAAGPIGVPTAVGITLSKRMGATRLATAVAAAITTVVLSKRSVAARVATPPGAAGVISLRSLW
jgi:hypothetical protein